MPMKPAVMPDSYKRATSSIPIRKPVQGKPIYKIPIVKPKTEVM